MAYSEPDAHRIRAALAEQSPVDEKKMFGGLAFMVNGHMCVGLSNDRLMVRVGKDAHDEALAQPYVRPMDFTGRPMKGFLFVDPPGYATDEDLQAWVDRCLTYVLSLPPK